MAGDGDRGSHACVSRGSAAPLSAECGCTHAAVDSRRERVWIEYDHSIVERCRTKTDGLTDGRGSGSGAGGETTAAGTPIGVFCTRGKGDVGAASCELLGGR